MSFWKRFSRRPRILTISVKVVVNHYTETGEFLATAPALPGLFEVGDSEDEVLELMKDGILVYLESLYRDSKPVPVGPDFEVEFEDVPVRFGGASVAAESPVSGDSPDQWATTKWHIPKKPANNLEESLLQKA